MAEPGGISKKNVRHALDSILEYRGLLLSEDEIEHMVTFCHNACLGLSKNKKEQTQNTGQDVSGSARSKGSRGFFGKLLKWSGANLSRYVPHHRPVSPSNDETQPIDIDNYHDAATSRELVKIESFAKLFHSDRRISCLEFFFTPIQMRQCLEASRPSRHAVEASPEKQKPSSIMGKFGGGDVFKGGRKVVSKSESAIRGDHGKENSTSAWHGIYLTRKEGQEFSHRLRGLRQENIAISEKFGRLETYIIQDQDELRTKVMNLSNELDKAQTAIRDNDHHASRHASSPSGEDSAKRGHHHRHSSATASKSVPDAAIPDEVPIKKGAAANSKDLIEQSASALPPPGHNESAQPPSAADHKKSHLPSRLPGPQESETPLRPRNPEKSQRPPPPEANVPDLHQRTLALAERLDRTRTAEELETFRCAVVRLVAAKEARGPAAADADMGEVGQRALTELTIFASKLRREGQNEEADEVDRLLEELR